MKWPQLDEFAALVPLPAGYQWMQLDRALVAPLIQALRVWHPTISIGVASAYLQEAFYEEKVCLDGRDDKDIFAAVISFNGELVGFWSTEREIDSLAIYGRLLVLAAAHRGSKLSVQIMNGATDLGRAMGAQFHYALATLSIPHVQRMLESAGYQLLGFFPGYDREEVAPGVVKRVYHAVYGRLLVPKSEVHWPDPQNMSPHARALFALLFEGETVRGTPEVNLIE